MDKISSKSLGTLSTNTALGTSDTLTPTQNAVKTYVDTHTTTAYEDVFTSTAGQTVFTLTHSPLSPQGTILIINAAVSASDQFTLSTNTLTMNTALAGGDKVVVKYNYQTLSITDAYAIHTNLSGEVNGLTEKTAPIDADLFIIEDSANSNSKKKVQLSNVFSYGRYLTEQNKGVWADIIWKDTTNIIINPKSIDGQTAFIGVILNTGEYLQTTSAITITLAAPAGGQILDGITAVQNNAWYIIWFYKNSGGTLAAGYTWMPTTTFTTNNPTTSLTLNQVNSQDIGLLYNPNANLLVWNASAKFETWLYNTTGGYTPTGAAYVALRTSTVLTLDGALSVTNFSSGDTVAQLDNFKPLQVSDGAVASTISTRGYRDSGVRIRTNASAQIIEFIIRDGRFFYANGTGAADHYGYDTVTYTASYVTYKSTYIPLDARNIYMFPVTASGSLVFRNYYNTYGSRYAYCDATIAAFLTEFSILHGLYAAKYVTAAGDNYIKGYRI